MTNDTQQDTDESGKTNSATLKRRDVIAGLGAAGVFAAAASGQSQDSVGTTIGGGPMSSEVSHLKIEWTEGSLSERPDAGVENRYFRVDDESDAEYGMVYRDDGSSWGPVDVGFGLASVEEQRITGKLDRTPGGGGYIYILGGTTMWSDASTGQTRSEETQVLVYDIDRGEYQQLPPMTYGRSDMVAVEYNDYLWAFGGDETGGDKVERYDLTSDSDTWEEMPSLNTGRYRLSTNGVVIDGNVYICCGGDKASPATRYKTVEKYDLNNQTVDFVSDAPVTQSFPMQSEYDGYLWLITGNSDDVEAGLIQRYDPSTDSWDGPSNFTRHPFSVTDGAGTQVGDEWHFIGGWSPDGPNPDPARHYAYSYDDDSWSEVRQLHGDYSHGKVKWDGTYLHRFGGRMAYRERAFTWSAWRYHLDKGKQATAEPLPNPAWNMTLVYSETPPRGRY